MKEREGVTTTAEWSMEGSIMGESWRAEYYMYLLYLPYLTYGTRRYRYLLGGTAIGKTEAGAGQEQGRNRAGAIMVMGLSVARGNEAEVTQVGVVWDRTAQCLCISSNDTNSHAHTSTWPTTFLVLLLTCSAPRLWFHALLAALGQASPRQ